MVERAVRREVVNVTRDVSNVCVGCNLPNGLELQLYARQAAREQTPNGPRDTTISVKKGEAIKLHGVARRFGADLPFPVIQGYAMTAVPKPFWDQWCEQNADADVIANRGILAGADQAELTEKIVNARRDKIKSGMAPIDPKAPPSVGGGLKVQAATTMS